MPGTLCPADVDALVCWEPLGMHVLTGLLPGTATPRTRPGPGHSSPGRGWGAQESVELSDVTRANPTPESQSEGRPRPFQLCCGFCVHDGSHSQVPPGHCGHIWRRFSLW